MKKIIQVILVIAIGLGAVYYIATEIGGNRLTEERRASIRVATEKAKEAEVIDVAVAPEAALADPTPEPAPEPTDDPIVLAANTSDEPETPAADATPWPEETPEAFQVLMSTTKGDVKVYVYRDLSPIGVDRFYELCKIKYYDGCRFFRVIPGFMAQFGISADPKLTAKWSVANIKDDPVKQGNQRGWISYGMLNGVRNSRSAQLFINYGDNSRLDGMGFAAFAEVVEGMEYVDAINAKYGEQPRQEVAKEYGDEYFQQAFPDLDAIKSITYLGPIPEESEEPADASAQPEEAAAEAATE